jgi:hypothetical protein
MESESGGGHFPRVFRLLQGPQSQNQTSEEKEIRTIWIHWFNSRKHPRYLSSRSCSHALRFRRKRLPKQGSRRRLTPTSGAAVSVGQMSQSLPERVARPYLCGAGAVLTSKFQQPGRSHSQLRGWAVLDFGRRLRWAGPPQLWRKAPVPISIVAPLASSSRRGEKGSLTWRSRRDFF